MGSKHLIVTVKTPFKIYAFRFCFRNIRIVFSLSPQSNLILQFIQNSTDFFMHYLFQGSQLFFHLVPLPMSTQSVKPLGFAGLSLTATWNKNNALPLHCQSPPWYYLKTKTTVVARLELQHCSAVQGMSRLYKRLNFIYTKALLYVIVLFLKK